MRSSSASLCPPSITSTGSVSNSHLTSDGVKSNDAYIVYRRAGLCFSPRAWDNAASRNGIPSAEPLVALTSMESTASTWDVQHCLTPPFGSISGVTDVELPFDGFPHNICHRHGATEQQSSTSINAAPESHLRLLNSCEKEEPKLEPFLATSFASSSYNNGILPKLQQTKRQRLSDVTQCQSTKIKTSSNEVTTLRSATENAYYSIEKWEPESMRSTLFSYSSEPPTANLFTPQCSVLSLSSTLPEHTEVTAEVPLLLSTSCLLDDRCTGIPKPNPCVIDTDVPGSSDVGTPCLFDKGTYPLLSRFDVNGKYPALLFAENGPEGCDVAHSSDASTRTSNGLPFLTTPSPKSPPQLEKQEGCVNVAASPITKLAGDTGTTTATTLTASPSPEKATMSDCFPSRPSSEPTASPTHQDVAKFEPFESQSNVVLTDSETFQACPLGTGQTEEGGINLLPSSDSPSGGTLLHFDGVDDFSKQPFGSFALEQDCNAVELNQSSQQPLQSVSPEPCVALDQKKTCATSVLSPRVPSNRLHKTSPMLARPRQRPLYNAEQGPWSLSIRPQQDHMPQYGMALVSPSCTGAPQRSGKVPNDCRLETVPSAMYRLPRSPTARAAIVHYPYPPVPAECLPPLKHTQQQALFNEFLKVETDALRVQLGHFIVEYCTRSIPDEYFRSERTPDPGIITDFVDQIILAVEIFGEHAQYAEAHNAIPTDINEVYISTWLQQKKEFLKPLEMLYRKRQRQRLFASQNRDIEFEDGANAATSLLMLQPQQRKRNASKKVCASNKLQDGAVANRSTSRASGAPTVNGSGCVSPLMKEQVVRRTGQLRHKDNVFSSRSSLSSTSGGANVGRTARRIGISLGEELDSLGVPRTIHYENLRSAIENRGIVVQLPSNGNANSTSTMPYFFMDSHGIASTGGRSSRYSSQFRRRSLFNLLISGRGDTRRSRLQLPWGDTVNIKYNRTLLGIPDFLVEGLGYGQCSSVGNSHPLIPKVCAVSLEDSLYGVEVLLFYRGLQCNKRMPKRFVLSSSQSSTTGCLGGRRPPPGAGTPIRRSLNPGTLSSYSYYHKPASGQQPVGPYLVHSTTSASADQALDASSEVSNINLNNFLHLDPSNCVSASQQLGTLNMSMPLPLQTQWNDFQNSAASLNSSGPVFQPPNFHQLSNPSAVSTTTVGCSQSDPTLLYDSTRNVVLSNGAHWVDSNPTTAVNDGCSLPDHFSEESQAIEIDVTFPKDEATPGDVPSVGGDSCTASAVPSHNFSTKSKQVGNLQSDVEKDCSVSRNGKDMICDPYSEGNEPYKNTGALSAPNGAPNNLNDSSGLTPSGISRASVHSTYQHTDHNGPPRKRHKHQKSFSVKENCSSDRRWYKEGKMKDVALCSSHGESAHGFLEIQSTTNNAIQTKEWKDPPDTSGFTSSEVFVVSNRDEPVLPSTEAAELTPQCVFSPYSYVFLEDSATKEKLGHFALEGTHASENNLPEKMSSVPRDGENESYAQTGASGSHAFSGESGIWHSSQQQGIAKGLSTLSYNAPLHSAHFTEGWESALCEKDGMNGDTTTKASSTYQSLEQSYPQRISLPKTLALQHRVAQSQNPEDTITSHPDVSSSTYITASDKSAYTCPDQEEQSKNISLASFQHYYLHQNCFAQQEAQPEQTQKVFRETPLCLEENVCESRHTLSDKERRMKEETAVTHTFSTFTVSEAGSPEVNPPDSTYSLPQTDTSSKFVLPQHPNIHPNFKMSHTSPAIDASFEETLNCMAYINAASAVPNSYNTTDLKLLNNEQRLSFTNDVRQRYEDSVTLFSAHDADYQSAAQGYNIYPSTTLFSSEPIPAISNDTAELPTTFHSTESLRRTTAYDEAAGLSSADCNSSQNMRLLSYTKADSSGKNTLWYSPQTLCSDQPEAKMFPPFPKSLDNQQEGYFRGDTAQEPVNQALFIRDRCDGNIAKPPSRRARLIVSCCATDKSGSLYRYHQQSITTGRNYCKTSRRWRCGQRDSETYVSRTPGVTPTLQQYYDAIAPPATVSTTPSQHIPPSLSSTAVQPLLYNYSQNHPTSFAPQANNGENAADSFYSNALLPFTDVYHYPSFQSSSADNSFPEPQLSSDSTALHRLNESTVFSAEHTTNNSDVGQHLDYAPPTEFDYSESRQCNSAQFYSAFPDRCAPY